MIEDIKKYEILIFLRIPHLYNNAFNGYENRLSLKPYTLPELTEDAV